MKNIKYLFLFIVFSLVGCTSTAKGGSKNKPEDGVEIIRFDKDVFNYLEKPSTELSIELKNKYPLLLPAFGRIAMGDSDPETFFTTLRDYFSNPALMAIYKDALTKFENVSEYEEQLAKAKHIAKDALPNKKMPQFAMHVSGFRENVIILNNLISISTDKYLGSDYPEYKSFFESYERQQMQANYIVRDYLKAWLLSDVLKSNEEKDLLPAMIQEGKVLYSLSVLLPEYKTEDIIGYTHQEFDWAKKNEKEIWQAIVKKNYLFSNDNMIVNRFISNAAHTNLISNQCPGQIGAWVGWQIICKYAQKENATLQQIMVKDAKEIIKEAKYNP